VSVEETLCRAIQHRLVVSLEYAKDPPGSVRRCHPHVVYESSTGKILVDVFQVDGYTSSGPLPAWRPLEVGLIRRVTVRDETFPLAPGYNPGNRQRYVRFICRI
jgi:hypothetical protein